MSLDSVDAAGQGVHNVDGQGSGGFGQGVHVVVSGVFPGPVEQFFVVVVVFGGEGGLTYSSS